MAFFIFFLGLDLGADKLAEQIDYGVPSFFALLLSLPLIGSLLTLAFAWLIIQAWRNSSGTLISRTYLTLHLAAAITYTLILYYWNLLGFHY